MRQILVMDKTLRLYQSVIDFIVFDLRTHMRAKMRHLLDAFELAYASIQVPHHRERGHILGELLSWLPAFTILEHPICVTDITPGQP